jgi:hypothetical protein
MRLASLGELQDLRHAREGDEAIKLPRKLLLCPDDEITRHSEALD